jgi:ATP-dependent Lhr-like helicase
VRERIEKKEARGETVKFIKDYLYCTREIADEIYDYIWEQGAFVAVPTDKEILVEKIKEDKEFLVFHTMYGRRVNDALARAYALAAGRLKMRDVEMGVHDNGFYIAGQHLEEEKILKWVKSKDVRAIVNEAIERTDVLRRRFRHCAGRAFMILRQYKGREKTVGRQQVHSELLYSAVKKISNEFPILQEARREVLEDVMDVEHAEQVVKWIEEKKIKFRVERVPIVRRWDGYNDAEPSGLG